MVMASNFSTLSGFRGSASSSGAAAAAHGGAGGGTAAAGGSAMDSVDAFIAAHKAVLSSLGGMADPTLCTGCGQKALGLRRCSGCKRASYCRWACSSRLAVNTWHQTFACCGLCRTAHVPGVCPAACPAPGPSGQCPNGGPAWMRMAACSLQQKRPAGPSHAQCGVPKEALAAAQGALPTGLKRWHVQTGMLSIPIGARLLACRIVLPPPQHALSSVLWDVLQLMNHT